MNVFDAMRKEHEVIKKGIQQVMRSMASSDADKLRETCLILERHLIAEEEVVYPRLQKIDEIRDLIAEGYEEHSAIHGVLKEISDKDWEVEDCGDQLEELRQLIEHHVREEEDRFFNPAEQIFSKDEIERLGKRVEEAKKSFSPTLR